MVIQKYSSWNNLSSTYIVSWGSLEINYGSRKKFGGRPEDTINCAFSYCLTMISIAACLVTLFLTNVVSSSFLESWPGQILQQLGGKCANFEDITGVNDGIESYFNFPIVTGNSPRAECSITMLFVNHTQDLKQLSLTIKDNYLIFSSGKEKDLESFWNIFRTAKTVFLIIPKTSSSWEGDEFYITRRKLCGMSKVDYNQLWIRGRYHQHETSRNQEENYSCIHAKAVAFPYEPYTILDEGQSDYRGLEVKIFKTIAEKLNLKSYSIKRPSDGGLWGEEISPGRFTGLMGDLQRDKADIGWAQLFIIPNRAKIIDYTSAYDIDYLCYMLAKPPPLPPWTAVVLPFELSIWLCLLTSNTLCVLLSVFFVWYLKQEKRFPYFDVIFYVYGAALDESLSFAAKVKPTAMRIFMAFFLFSSTITAQFYRSGLITNLSVPYIPKPIDTLKEASTYPAPIASFGDTFLKATRNSLNPHLQRLAENYIVHYNFGEAFKNVSEGKIIMGESRQFIDFNIRKHYTDEFGETGMHVMKECLTPYRVAFGLSKGNPLTRPFGRVIQRLIEAGLVRKWMKDELDLIARLSEVKTEAEAKPWTLNELQGAFLVSAVMTGLAALVFLLELMSQLYDRTIGPTF